jgi:hypothetical protein
MSHDAPGELVFLLSAALMLCFLAVLRGFLLRAKGGTARLSTLAFGDLDAAGPSLIIWCCVPAVRPSGRRRFC